jgi:chromosome partitioning protein
MPTTIALLGRKGGVGKTAISAALSWELAAQGRRVLAVDTDPQGTLSLMGERATEEKKVSPSIVRMGENLSAPAQLPRISEGFQFVVIDTPAKNDAVPRAALMVADLALVLGGMGASDTWAVAETVRDVKSAQVLRPHLKAAILLTRLKPHTAIGRTVRDGYAEAGLPLLTAFTCSRIEWVEATDTGQGVTLYAPKSKAAAEARAVLEEALHLLSPPKPQRKRSRG